jgi:FkbM family methyltransferase
MAANSAPRRVLKRILHPFLNEHSYRYVQAAAMAWDIRSGKFIEPEMDLVPLAARPGETALDLGANYGAYAYRLSKAVGPGGKVHAFEPVSFTNQTLRLVLKMLRVRNVEVHPQGCGEGPARVSFRVPVQASGAPASGLAYIGHRNDDHPGAEVQVRWDSTREVPCDIVAIDEVLPGIEGVSFIKCDVEGAEILAFRGARGLVDRNRPTVLVEINPWYIEGFGLDLGELTGYFSGRGYGLYRYDERRLRPVHDPGEIIERNYLFIPPERLERFQGVV